MTSQATINSLLSGPAVLVATAVLDTIASRWRHAGVCVCLLDMNGAVTYHDPLASPFFRDYVLPQLRGDLGKTLAAADHAGRLPIDRSIPGTLLGVYPRIEKRHAHGILVLAAVDAAIDRTEDLQRAAGRLRLDAQWLLGAAGKLPAYDDDSFAPLSRLILDMLVDLTHLAAARHEIDSMSSELSASYEELTLIYQLSAGMHIDRSPADFFRQACMEYNDFTGVRATGVALAVGALPGAAPAMFGPMNLPPPELHRLGNLLVDAFGDSQAPIVVNDLASSPKFAFLAHHARQLLAVPLFRPQRHLGALFALDKITNDFDSHNVKLLISIANTSAIYLENSILYEDVRGLVMGLLHSLTSAVDAKDPYTCGHSRRVALLSRRIAREAGLDDALCERIYVSGLLHDVGKIGVPEAVLCKPGKLTSEEFDMIKRHPAIGAHILKDIKQIQDVIPGVLYHHERYDGRGYPTALAAENIPLMGRVICVADCLDAMTSTRTYRNALPLEAALLEIERGRGTQFDPAMADALLRIGEGRLKSLLAAHHTLSTQGGLFLDRPGESDPAAAIVGTL
jgi:HD-GYP domain-containing protein (c-di-GMP phosphodiesterase class II)